MTLRVSTLGFKVESLISQITNANQKQSCHSASGSRAWGSSHVKFFEHPRSKPINTSKLLFMTLRVSTLGFKVESLNSEVSNANQKQTCHSASGSRA